jgi:hypothetical protein
MMAGMISLILTGLLRGVRTLRSLVLENLALRHQLVILQRAVPRPPLRTADRLFSVLLSRLWADWTDAFSVVQPATVIRWQRAGFTLFWAWNAVAAGPWVRLVWGSPPSRRRRRSPNGRGTRFIWDRSRRPRRGDPTRQPPAVPP